MVGITFSDRQWQELETILGPKVATQAASSALKKALAKSKTMMARQVASRLKIDKKGALGDKSSPVLVTKVWGTDQPQGRLTVYKRRTRAIRFNSVSPNRIIKEGRTPLTGGVKVQFNQFKPSLTFASAFLAKMPYRNDKGGESTSLAVMIHVKGKTRTGKGKLKQIFGPSVYSLLGGEKLNEMGKKALEKMRGFLREELLSQIDRFLKRKKEDRPAGELSDDFEITSE